LLKHATTTRNLALSLDRVIFLIYFSAKYLIVEVVMIFFKSMNCKIVRISFTVRFLDSSIFVPVHWFVMVTT
jgi:hypothetical protein